MKIAEATSSDYDRLRSLFLNERKATFSWVDTSLYCLEDFEKETVGEHILIAVVDDLIIGFISIWLPNNFIHHLYVDQKYQGKGVGTKLLEAAIQKTGLPISLKCLENNLPAIAFYKRKGFIEKEKGQSEHGTYILFRLLEILNSSPEPI